MQAVAFGRLRVGRTVVTLAAIGILALGIVAGSALQDSDDASNAVGTPALSPNAWYSEAHRARSNEESSYRPTGRSTSTVMDYDRMLFLEQNLEVSIGAVEPTDWALIEQIRWGTDSVFATGHDGLSSPSVDNVPQIQDGEMNY